MYHFIVNPGSKTSKTNKTWTKIKKILKEKQIEYTDYLTSLDCSATDIAKMLTSSSEECTLIVLGGDGTLNEVINGIQDFNTTTLGFIPTGSSNDFARGLRYPKNPYVALDKILKAKNIHEIDLGDFSFNDTTRKFIGSSGIGFDASICKEALSSKIKRVLNHLGLGKLTYLMIALKTLFEYKTSGMLLTIDGKQYSYEKCYFACILNNKFEGGGFKFTPDASLDDGLLDICLVQGRAKLFILCVLPTAFFGLHTKFKGVHIHKGKEFIIKPTSALHTHVDGEVCGEQENIDVTVAEEKLRLLL